MTTHDHDRWLEKLSEHVDGSLSAAETTALEAHLAGCAECRQALADLRDIVARAHALGPSDPERDLWPGIAQSLEGQRVLPFPATRRRSEPRGLFLTLPQLAAAAAVVTLVSGAATWWAGFGVGARASEPATASAAAPEPPPATLVAQELEPAPDLARELSSLEAVLARARSTLDPNTVRILEKNLGVIERAIGESRRALELDPGNEYLRQHLDRTYRDKADFLREVALLTEWEG